MGGSGGGFWAGKPGKFADAIREAHQATGADAYEAEVAQFLSEVLAAVNSRDVDTIARHVESIRRALNDDIDGAIDLLFGGSISRRTYVDGISDVDALVILDRARFDTDDPELVCAYLGQRMTDRFPRGNVARDGFAVSVWFGELKVELVPVLRTPSGVALPKQDLSGWVHVDPALFAQRLTAANAACGGKVVPAIKLAKKLFASVPENRRPRSFHLEAIAVEAFRDFNGPFTPKGALLHLLKRGAELVRTPIADVTGQSWAADSYLGLPGSLERLLVANSFRQLVSRIGLADGMKSLDSWREMFDDF